jgi:CheY-like chemotaxis protein
VGELRVLVADDHEAVRTLVVRLLSQEFQIVAQVADGEQLVEAAARLQPDVIVSDILMPVMGGISARKTLLSRHIDIPFVFITLLKFDSLPSAPEEGVAGYVHKADMATELKLAIRAVALGYPYTSHSFRR